jgi:hypothetical protein
MVAKSTRLGPGTLTIGTATPFDASCQLANGVVAWDKDKDDDIRVLCGDTVPGATTYTSTFSGTFLQDLADEAGLVAYTWEHKGESLPFEFVPNTAAGATVTGTIGRPARRRLRRRLRRGYGSRFRVGSRRGAPARLAARRPRRCQ